jgi:hypothetical protein
MINCELVSELVLIGGFGWLWERSASYLYSSAALLWFWPLWIVQLPF